MAPSFPTLTRGGAGVAFAEEGDENCGCGGPVLAVFRLEQDPEGKHFLLGERS